MLTTDTAENTTGTATFDRFAGAYDLANAVHPPAAPRTSAT